SVPLDMSSANMTFNPDHDTSEEEKCAVIDEFSIGKSEFIILSDTMDIIKNEDMKIIDEIDKLTPEIIEYNQNIKLINKDKKIVTTIRRTIITYAENLNGLKLPVSEFDFNNAFLNMLIKRFLDKQNLKMDRLAKSVTFGDSVNSLKAIIGLKSGGLPVAHHKKVIENQIDLSIVIRDVLYNFFKTNSNASENDLYHTYILDCKATNVLHLGRLSQINMPNTMKTLTILKGFYTLISDINESKRKNEHYNQSEPFGVSSEGPINKKDKKRED
ncbi:13626_t:CDS:2, partial [Funneliformis geosporum]